MMSFVLSEDEDELTFGTPTLSEIKSYFLNTRWSNMNPSDTSASSAELNESFKQILEARQKRLEEERKMNKSPASSHHTGLSKSVNSTIWQSINDTVVDEQPSWTKCSDETFLEMENMCNVTKIENNKYLNFTRDSLATEKSEATTTDYTPDSLSETGQDDNRYDDEIIAMNRLMNEYKVKATDETQLNDIEAPSGLWDHTILNMGGDAAEPSPVKMVGMLRPSTIIEENTIDESCSSSSYKTAASGPSKETSAITNFENDSLVSVKSTHSNTQNVRPSMGYRPKKKYIFYDEQAETSLRSGNSSQRSNESSNLHDHSFATAHQTNHRAADVSKTISLDNPNDIIEISDNSDVSCSPEIEISNNKIHNTLEDISSLPDESYATNSKSSSNSFQSHMGARSQSSYGQSESTKDSAFDISHDFNDTLEEIEYMTQQGMKYLQQTQSPAVNAMMKNSVVTPINTKYNSPKTPTTIVAMKQKNFNSPSTGGKLISGHKLATLSNSKPTTPNSFKKPTTFNTRIPQPKLLHTKKPFYDYVVSPISVYIKNTPTVPLSIQDKGDKNIFGTKFYQKTSKDINSVQDNCKENIKEFVTASTLPRKGYISAENRHVFDQRKITKIHGGEKVHRLIGAAATSPSITKHEGRLKMHTDHKFEGIDKANVIVDESFADLSIMSGDVSVQVVKNVLRP